MASGSSHLASLGDGLRALQRLAPHDAELAKEILQRLGIVTRQAEKDLGAFQASGVAHSAEPQGARLEASADLPARTDADSTQLPSVLPSEIEEMTDNAVMPPDWLVSAPLIPLPATIPNPFREYSRPLFEPRWQRAIVTRLACVLARVGPLDIGNVIDQIARGRPLTAVPRHAVQTAAKGLQLLIEQAESMEPFRQDVAELTRAFRRTIGASRVAVHSFRHLPTWECGADLEAIEYRAPASGVPIVILGDLGLPPRPAQSHQAHPDLWCSFLKRLRDSRHGCSLVVPRSAKEIPAIYRRYAQSIAWDRSTAVSRLGKSDVLESSVHDPMRENDAGELSSGAWELACLSSLASRVEPQLLRALRLQLAAAVPVSAEAELWLSDLVELRASTGIVFSARHREALQQQLARDQSKLQRAFALIQAVHVNSPPALRMEEELAYRWLIRDDAGARSLLRSLVATVVSPERRDASKWAARALVRLPAGLVELEEMQMLALGTALRTGEVTASHLPTGTGGGWHWLRPASAELEVGVTLREEMLEFGPRSIRPSHVLRVPNSNPVLLEIANIAVPDQVHRLRINPLSRTTLNITGSTFDINVLGGARWQVREVSRSAQKFVARNRAPRVQIEYDVELYGAVTKKQLPFVVGVLADLSSRAELPELALRKFIDIDADTFDSCMNRLAPRAAFTVEDRLTIGQKLSIDLTFDTIDGFSPAAVASKVPPLADLLGQRATFTALLELSRSDRRVQQWLTRAANPKPGTGMISMRAIAGPGLSNARAAEIDAALLLLFTAPYMRNHTDSGDIDAFIQTGIDEIDKQLSKQLNEILHHPQFQRLEGTWRGLHHLVMNTETNEMLKIRILDVSKAELSDALLGYTGEKVFESPVFKKLYEEEFGIFGGEPFGCFVGDYYFDNSANDVALLGSLARISAEAHAPFISAAAPGLFGLESWQEIASPRDIAGISDSPEHSMFQSLRQQEEARYVGLTLPRFLSRLPYGAKTQPVEAFAFEEETTKGDSSQYTWSNSAYAFATNVARAFRTYGWCARIRGVESGGEVSGLPVHTFPADDGGVDMQCSVEIAITERRESELSRCGLIPLIHRKHSDAAIFISAQSLQRPTEFDEPEATANAALAARLPYIFACSRFAQYLKCIVRDKIGTFKGHAHMERWLSDWIASYVDANPASSSDEMRARKPLAGAEIEIDERSTSGRVLATFALRPHHQLEGLTINVRLKSHLPDLRSESGHYA